MITLHLPVVFTCTESFTGAETLVIYWITVAASILSLFGSSWMIFNYIAFGQGKGISQMVACLALCDYLWSVNCIITYALLLYKPDLTTFDMCLVLRLSWATFAMSSVFWTASITFYLYIVLSDYQPLLKRRRALKFTFHIMCWGLPLTFSFLNWKLKQIVSGGFGVCFPAPIAHLLLWFLPIAIVFAFTLVTYILILRTMSRQYRVLKANHRRDALSKSRIFIWRVSLYVVVFLICWPVDIVTYILNYFVDCTPLTLVCIYSATLQLQGALDAIVYGVANRRVRKHYRGLTDSRFRTGVIFVVFVLVSPVTMWLALIGKLRRWFLSFVDQKLIYSPPTTPSPLLINSRASSSTSVEGTVMEDEDREDG